ncbi:Uncharacterized protein Fot_08917 [Forsythia ovata]|uniref:Uncharacterized protein n=1 Tax=Forsythia ovata TaxID=205694 RepID=A0ABD1WCS5_9LAMI
MADHRKNQDDVRDAESWKKFHARHSIDHQKNQDDVQDAEAWNKFHARHSIDLDVDLEKGKALQSSSLNFNSKYNIVPYINPSAALDPVNDTKVEAAGGSRVTVRIKAAVKVVGESIRKAHYNKLGFREMLKPEWFKKKDMLLPKADLEEIL